MVRRWMSISLMALVATSAAFAQDAKMRRLDNGVDARIWEAVGRLDIDGKGFCTGAMIAPNLVLTAAHCLFDSRSGERIDPAHIEFRAGWRNGRASAYRGVRRAVVHPDYAFDGQINSHRVRNDLALLELDRPVRNTTIVPFSTADRPQRGDKVGVVSYAKDRAEAPSLQEVCTVLSEQDGVLVTSCAVDFGSSGAPIFTLDDGVARIVSVVSAKAEVEGRDVSLGTGLTVPLATLRAELVAGRGVFQEPGPASRRIKVGEARANTGAKFVKP